MFLCWVIPCQLFLVHSIPTITSGIVSNPFGFGEQPGEFQMTTKINPGNSGGPIFNEFGKIVGVATARLDKAGIFKDEGIIADSMSIGDVRTRPEVFESTENF